MPRNISLHQKNLIYQGNNGEILLREDKELETIWANQAQISEIFDIDQSVTSRHIRNIFKDGEIDKKSNMQKMHIATSDKPVSLYNLDIILSIGYRTNSSKAIAFRKWANSILKNYITQGVVINTSLLQENSQKFQQALEYLNSLSSENLSKLESKEILSLIESYAQTWLSLDAYDKQCFPEDGLTQTLFTLSAQELSQSINELKQALMTKGEASDLFAQEKTPGSLIGIVGNIFQTFDGEELYHSLEEKSAHLLYFIVKNHVFTDGNKRSGAFSFIWFLQKSGYTRMHKISPETLTTLTLLMAESDPREKEKMIGLVLLLLQ